MKKFLSLILVLGMICLLAVPALAEDDDKTITVQGNAVVYVQPDYATLMLGAITKGETVEQAQTENSRLIDSIMAALLAIGIDEKDIETSYFNLSVVYNYDYYSSLGETQAVSGYQVENTLKVTVRDLDKISAVLDAGMQAGANQSYGITFMASQENSAGDLALQNAVKEAARKAALVAEAAGLTLGEVIDVTEGSYGYSYSTYRSSQAYAEDSAAGTTILSSQVEVTATVTMTYSVK